MTLSEDVLRAVMPRVGLRAVCWVAPLGEAMVRAEITSPLRMAAFLAQIAHESGELRYVEELWGPTPQQLKYEPPSSVAWMLGNTEPGDGHRYRGRGPIQLTGRGNYRRMGPRLGVDLEADPDLARDPDIGSRIATTFWADKHMNRLADEGTIGAFMAVTRRINGGATGWSDRTRYYTLARRALGIDT